MLHNEIQSLKIEDFSENTQYFDALAEKFKELTSWKVSEALGCINKKWANDSKKYPFIAYVDCPRDPEEGTCAEILVITDLKKKEIYRKAFQQWSEKPCGVIEPLIPTPMNISPAASPPIVNTGLGLWNKKAAIAGALAVGLGAATLVYKMTK